MSTGTIVTAIILVVLGGILLLFLMSFFLPIGSGKPNDHGSAEFTRQSALAHGNKGWVIDGDRKALSRKNSYTHLLLLAPTGFGKSTNFCIPNLLELDDCSIVVTDPKGDLYETCGDALSQKGYNVLLFDAEQPANSCHFNPLLRLSDDADIQHFANSLIEIENRTTEAQAIWTLGPARLIQGLIVCLKNLPDERYCNIAVLIQLMKSLNTLKIRHFINTYGDLDTQEWFADWIVKPDKTREGQVMSAQAALTRFDTQKMKLLTADDSFDFSMLRRENTAIFLKLPSGDPGRLGPIISIFYSQLFQEMLSAKLTPTDLGIMAILEEFGNLSVIPNLASVITLIRSKKVGLALVCQDLQQIYNLYKGSANTIISNCSSILAYPGIKDPATLKYLTQLLGKATVEIKTPGRTPHLAGRNLLNEDEIRTLSASAGLFIHGNYYGEKITTLPVYQNKHLMKKFGLQSIAGDLVPERILEQPPTTLAEKFIRFPLEEKQERQPEKGIERNLDQILDDIL
jgi:type IV secretory pathway TraG/TraD family ATPase VirD4